MIYSDQTATSSMNTNTFHFQDLRSEPCQVCGEIASGWHCGSITCEACKKFFLRSINGEYLKYKCMREQKCIITRTTRTQCQFCRYSKCVAIGMKIVENSNPKIEEIFKEIPCAVCRSASSGIHFGATTCEGCKGFFRRMVKERIPEHYKCSERNNCEVNALTRNMCRACRFRKCLMAGMSTEGSRIGRQSNLFKHKMVEMQRQGLIQSQLLTIVTTNVKNSRKKSSYINQKSKVPSMLENKLDPEMYQQILIIEKAYHTQLQKLPIYTKNTLDLWMTCIDQLNSYANRIKEFVDQIPNFDLLDANEKTSLIHVSLHSVILMCHCAQSLRSPVLGQTWNYLNLRSDSPSIECIQQQYPFFFDFNHLIRELEKELQLLALDDTEIALTLTLLITSIGRNTSKDVEYINDELFTLLFDYMAAKRGMNNKDYFILTIQIPLFHRINNQISMNLSHLEYLSSCQLIP